MRYGATSTSTSTVQYSTVYTRAGTVPYEYCKAVRLTAADCVGQMIGEICTVL